ncbi:MAG: GNAT family N-acetyltransferase, partial [Roseibacillus sp.]
MEGELVASACLYSLPMTVKGTERRGAQISSVGTLPSYRRRGPNRELTRWAQEWARQHDHALHLSLR